MQATVATPATVSAIIMPRLPGVSTPSPWRGQVGTGGEAGGGERRTGAAPENCLTLVDTKKNMLYHCDDGEVSLGSRSHMDETHVERRLAAILVADIA